MQQIEEEPQAKRPENTTWANLVENNRFGLRGMNLSFVAPIIQNGETIVELAKNEVEKETEKWRNALILYVVGNTPMIGALERFVAIQWNFVAKQ